MFTGWKYSKNYYSHLYIHQVIKMLILVVILFLLCWGPRWLYHQIVNFHHHLYPQVHHGDPAQDGDPAVHCYCLLDQVINHHRFYLITFFVYRVVLFLFPFIHAIGQIILIVRRLSNNCVLFSEPSDLCRNEQVVQELFIQDDEGVVLQDGEQGGQHHEHRK